MLLSKQDLWSDLQQSLKEVLGNEERIKLQFMLCKDLTIMC